MFSGAGGFSLAAIEAGMQIAAAVEYDKAAAETYRNNIPKAQTAPLDFHQGDILVIDPKKIAQRIAKSCDVVLGGPPCQGFSVHRINGAGVDDERNKLILRYFEYVSALQPKVFLMENVPGILWERHNAYLKAFYLEGERAGYKICKPEVLDARDYGLPQRRKRVFILGIRKDVADVQTIKFDWPPAKTHGDQRARALDPNLLPWETAASVFKLPLDEYDENNAHMRHRSDLVEVFKSTPLNGGSRNQSSRVLPCHVKHNGHTDVYGRINPNEPGPTMTTACVNPSKGRFLHPTEHHGITVRHAARFQTFPEWFVFSGGIMAAARQVGNAVPVKFGEVLLRKIKNILDQYHSASDK